MLEFPSHANFPSENKYLRKAILEVFKGKCFYTGRDVDESNMHIDHIVPQAEGGPDNIYNYALTHKDTNQLKSKAYNSGSVKSTLYFLSITLAPKVLERVKQLLKSSEKSVVPSVCASLDFTLGSKRFSLTSCDSESDNFLKEIPNTFEFICRRQYDLALHPTDISVIVNAPVQHHRYLYILPSILTTLHELFPTLLFDWGVQKGDHIFTEEIRLKLVQLPGKYLT